MKKQMTKKQHTPATIYGDKVTQAALEHNREISVGRPRKIFPKLPETLEREICQRFHREPICKLVVSLGLEMNHIRKILAKRGVVVRRGRRKGTIDLNRKGRKIPLNAISTILANAPTMLNTEQAKVYGVSPQRIQQVMVEHGGYLPGSGGRRKLTAQKILQ